MAKQHDDKFKELLELNKKNASSSSRTGNSSSPISSPSGTESDSVRYSFLEPNIIEDAVDEAKYPVASPAINKPKRSTPKSRTSKKADDAVREDNKKRQKYFRDQMKELFEKLASVLRPPLGKDEKTKKVLQCAIDYIENLHSLLEYYQNLTQQIAAMNPELFQYVSSHSPPPTPTHSSQNPISVVSSTPPSPQSSRTDQSSFSQGTANSSRRLPSSPGSTDASSTEVSWISQVLQFSSPSRSPNAAYLTQYDVSEFEKMLSGQSPQYSPGTHNHFNNMVVNQSYRNQSLQQQPSSPMQQQQSFNQYSSFLPQRASSYDDNPFDMPASPASKPSPSHSWSAFDSLAPAPASAPSSVSMSVNSMSSLGGSAVRPHTTDPFVSSQSASSGFANLDLSDIAAPATPTSSSSSISKTVAIKLEPTSSKGPTSAPSAPNRPTVPAQAPRASSSPQLRQSQLSHSSPAQPQMQYGSLQQKLPPQSKVSAQPPPAPSQRALQQPSPASLTNLYGSIPAKAPAPAPAPASAPAPSLLACDEDAFDWSSVSSTPNQTPDRKPIPSLEALSDSLQSLTVSKANGGLTPTVVIKTEK